MLVLGYCHPEESSAAGAAEAANETKQYEGQDAETDTRQDQQRQEYSVLVNSALRICERIDAEAEGRHSVEEKPDSG
jgi:hypothetical protein